MGKIYEKAHAAWYDALFGELHEKEKALEAAGNRDGVFDCWREISQLLAQDSERIKAYFPKGEVWDFSEAKKKAYIARNDTFSLIPITEKYTEDFVKVRRLHNFDEKFSDDLERAILDRYRDELTSPNSFICAAVTRESDRFCGYVSVKDSSLKLWEIAIELLPEYCGHGFGPVIIPLFLNAVKELTGRNEFRAIVEPDNYASQRCMKKAGAKLAGLTDYIFGDRKAAEKFENANLDLITDEMSCRAEELGVEPKCLLSALLDYRFSL